MITAEDLRGLATFEDQDENELIWLAAQAEELWLEKSGALFRKGDAAEHMFVFFEGAAEFRRADGQVFPVEAGDITGLLPFSRLATFQGEGWATKRTRIGRFHRSVFPEMIHRMPVVGQRLVGVMTDRVREVTRMDVQQEKLMALGKLAAGLAHELNNPAGAAKRAAVSLREVRPKLVEASLKLDCRHLTPEQRHAITVFEQRGVAQVETCSAVPSNSLEASDRESELEQFLTQSGVAEGWAVAPMLVEAEFGVPDLQALGKEVGGALGDALHRVHLVLTATRLVHEIDQSVTRISELVKAIKDYSYMDQAPEQEVSIHDGLESTLTILAFKLRNKSITVLREYDRSVPKICAYGVELNQVWTNLIVNAVDAMNEGGELRLRTWGDSLSVAVEVRDNGAGIPSATLAKVFEPFFTTKGVGQGTGLGLDTVQRIVRKHQGQVSVDSKPGDTRFVVRLPRNRNGKEKT